jgi:hypothetical protein
LDSPSISMILAPEWPWNMLILYASRIAAAFHC